MPNGRFSFLPGFGMNTRRIGGGRYPWSWIARIISGAQCMKLCFASSTVCPSQPGAELFGMWLTLSQTSSSVT
jgi:hypothetical protein